jgi:hypothetical protein
VDAECDEACRTRWLDCAAQPQASAVEQLRAGDIVRAERRAAEVAGETERAVALRVQEAEAREEAEERLSTAIESWHALVEIFGPSKFDRALALGTRALAGYALYRKARCLRNLDRNDEADATLDKLREWLSENPDAPGANELREALCRENPLPASP